MADLSLSKLLSRKRKLRIITIVCGLILVGALSAIFVSKNPRGTKAGSCNVSGKAIIIDASAVISNNITTSGTACSNTQNIESWDVIVTGAGTTVTVYGTNHFKSLTVQSDATITHSALVPVTDFSTASPWTLTSTGNAKKVDIIADGDVILQSGGKINVDGKGYPGGTATVLLATDGYGPGRSHGLNSPSGSDPAHDGQPTGGAGYGGAGGSNDGIYGEAYPAGYDSATFQEAQFFHGSGSGAEQIAYVSNKTQDGASGGGRVHIKASSIKILDASSTISANGSDGSKNHDGGVCAAAAGGGSGGTIWLESSDFVFSAGVNYSVAGGPGVQHDDQPYEDGDLGFFSQNTGGTVLNLFSVGGSGEYNCDGQPGGFGGGGGRIVVNKPTNQPITIKKTLEPVERPAGVPNVNFNPYALQVGDKIKVNLQVSNTVLGPLTIEDERLHIENANPAVYCDYDPSTLVGATATATSPALIFTDTITDASVEETYYYYCTVKSP